MFWNLLTKIMVDVLVGVLVELVVMACSALVGNYRRSRQVSFA
jgi:hypothetical protein